MPPKGKFAGRRGGRPPKGRGRPPKGSAKRSLGGGRKFTNTRLEDVPESESEISEEDVPSEVDEKSEGSDSDDDDKRPAPNQSYMALMQSLTKDSAAPSAKRRKLDHQSRGEELLHSPDQKPEAQVLDDDEEDAEDGDVDLVEEPEEDPAIEVDINDDSDDEAEPDTSDPFETHFSSPNVTELSSRLKFIESNTYQQKQLTSNDWRLVVSTPTKDPDQASRTPVTISGPSSLKLKHRLVETAQKKRPTFDKLEQVLYPITFGYQDLLFCGRTAANAHNLRRMTTLHAVNHIFKTRDRVIKNNAKLAKEGENSEYEPRDQGFTRPKVLVLLPTRESAVKVVEAICTLCEPDQQENRKRFDESYVDREVKFSTDRPADFRELFEGNDDDMFRIGIKFTRKTIKYFAQFYNSDILLASPLGLRMAIGSEEDKKKIDYDFLSSIEMVIVDQADAQLMQNWEHVEYIFEHLNRQPRDAHGCDFSRVREWYLENQAHYFRQTLILSAFNTPELAELHRRGKNCAGRIRVQPEYNGVIQELGPVKTKQTFSRFEAASIAEEPDARFTYFTSAVVPSLVKLVSSGRKKSSSSSSSSSNSADGAGGTLIFIPSYLDFVRVRNYFATSDAVSSLSFGAVSEYADVREASRARSHFLSGRHKVLLYTERAHHFRRYVFSGVRRIIMYGLPDNPIFYREIAGGFLAKSEEDMRLEPGRGSVRVLFSKYDALKLERVTGSKRVGKMIRERGDTYDFI
ncbi:DUF1253-domain-containing protein [Xylariaceae sp. FL0255]|nr:DUF1253-domain-containing protein [Xylariaceae sp. FL0255]